MPSTEAFGPPPHESTTFEVDDHRIGTVIGHRYRIISMLGQGGMGVAYKAEDISLDKVVVLKFLLPKLLTKDKELARFYREAVTAGPLDHPAIAKVWDFSTLDEPEPYLVIEFVDGQTLAQMIECRGQLPLDETLDVFIRLCDALAFAHSHNVLHRDVKPSNIMIADLPGEQRIVKLLDFGLAKFIQSPQIPAPTITETGELVGSPFYMSPEQARGGQLDIRSDLYSLGCTLYEALTGGPPHLGETALATILKRERDKPTSMSEASLGRNFPEQLEAMVSKLLQTDPEERYQSATELKNDLLKLSSSSTTKSMQANQIASDVEVASRTGRRIHIVSLIALATPLMIGVALILSPLLRQHNIQTRSVAPLAPVVPSPAVRSTCSKVIAATIPGALAQAESLSSKGEYEKADSILKPLLAACESNSPADETGEASALCELGSNYLRQSREAEAEKCYKQARAILTRINPVSHDMTKAIGELAEICFVQGRYKEAQSYYQQLIPIYTKLNGPENQELADSLNHLAAAELRQAPKTFRARQSTAQLFNKALSIYEQVFGRSNPSVFTCLYFQAETYHCCGLFPEAEQHFQQALKIADRVASNNPRPRGMAMIKFAYTYEQNHKYSKSTPLFAAAAKVFQRRNSVDSKFLGITVKELADHYAQTASHREPRSHQLADVLYQRVLPAFEKAPGPQGYDLATLLNSMGNNCYAAASNGSAKEYAKAEKYYRQALRILDRIQGFDNQALSLIYLHLGEACRKQQNFRDSDSFLRQALALKRKDSRCESTVIIYILGALADNCCVQGKYAEAVELAKQGLLITQQAPVLAQTIEFGQLATVMAGAYTLQGNYTEAKPLYMRARNIFQRTRGRECPQLIGINKELSKMHRHSRNY